MTLEKALKCVRARKSASEVLAEGPPSLSALIKK
jgi:hypothetical protein